MSRVRTIVLVALSVLASSVAVGGEQGKSALRLPVGNVTVAYRQLTDGKLGDMVFLCKLKCGGDSCELFTVSFNWCLPGLLADAKASAIAIDRTSTEDRSLEVVEVRYEKRQGVLVVKENQWGAEITYRFGFSLRDKTLEDAPWIESLTSFEAAAVKPFTLPDNKMSTWTLVPFKGRYSRWTPDCPIVLEGVPGP